MNRLIKYKPIYTWMVWMLMLPLSLLGQATIDLTDHEPSTAPPVANATLGWYTNAAATTPVVDKTNAAPGLYYAAYSIPGSPGCISTPAPLRFVAAPCGSAVSVNLADYVEASEAPNGYTISYHNGIPASAANELAGSTVTAVGTYYVAYKSIGSDNVTVCYHAASPIVVGVEDCVPDLTPTITLNNANFASSGTQKNFAINIFELLGASTSSAIAVQVSVAPGYELLDFSPALTSVNVSGAGAVSVQNSNWTLYSTPNVRTKVFTSANGFTLNRDDASLGQSSFGLSLKRVSASSGSTGNITVTIITDPSKTYDSNFLNNVFVRVLTSN